MAKSISYQELHKKGKTIFDYDDNLKYIVSAGVDEEIKVWSISKNEIVINYSLKIGVNCIVVENERIFINSGNRIEMLSIVNQSTNSYVFVSFTSNVNDMKLNKTKTKLVACSDDCTIKLINLNGDDPKREILFKGHNGPVCNASINCDDTYLASASCDGLLMIWDARTGNKLKYLPIVEKCADISNMKKLSILKWHPINSKVLGITMGCEIKFVEGDDFELASSVLCNEGELNDFAFNNEGNLLIGGTRNGWICIWDIVKKNLLTKWQNSRKSAIANVTWSGPSNIIFSDFNGCWEMFQVTLDQPIKSTANDDFDNSSLTMEEMNEIFDLSIENEEVIPRDCEKLQENTVDPSDEQSTTENQSESVHSDSFESDEDNEISLADLKAEYENPNKPEELPPPVVVNRRKTIQKLRQPHPPIRSTQCPRNGNKQILLWNPIGALKNNFDSENDYNCFLEVDFQDREVNSNLIYRHNVMRYELGDVNRQALMLISKQSDNCLRSDADSDDEDDDDDDDEDSQPAMVHVRPLNGSSWTEWNILLPSSREKVLGCCLVGQTYAVVMSDKFLRYFMVNAGGIQAYVESVHGSPVAIASSSSYLLSQSAGDKFIRVVIVTDDGKQLVWRIDLFKVTDKPVQWFNKGKMHAVVATSPWYSLPLSGSATLKWIGFSDSGALFTVDSKQSVRRLHLEFDENRKRFSEPRWIPVLNLRSALAKDCRFIDRYFPIGVMDRGERCCFLAVHCRDSRYPTVTPWQNLSMIDFRLPICGPTKSELIQNENGLLVNQLLTNWTDGTSFSLLELTEKQLLLKLFANAVDEDQDGRALSIGKLMPDSQVVQLAIRYAARNNKQYLAEKMCELAIEKDKEMSNTDELLQFNNYSAGRGDIENIEPASPKGVDPSANATNPSIVNSPRQISTVKTKRKSEHPIEGTLEKIMKK